MKQFIDEQRDVHGVEPICRVLPISPSTYHAHAARMADPQLRWARAKTDEALTEQVQRVWDDNFKVYGVRKVWRQLRREQFDVARCTVQRLMKRQGLRGRHTRQDRGHDGERPEGTVPAGSCETAIQGRSA
ncbi:hypothetical protein AVHM3334_22970 [Acidovorax sp. SUPP3334]|nr:hypothetical protein AVHM3334_22970 [Acidovorax sp. SUPP3334]